MPDQVVTRHLENAQEIINDAMARDESGDYRDTIRLLADALKIVIEAVARQNERTG
ncbi:MAG: hypothetical protein JO057_08170 [Chloroflexi bacterium]|nr:hypothetical protein [Chloroflexota bacterium]